MKLQNLIHILIGIVCVGLLPDARSLAAQSLRVDGAPLAPHGNVQQAWVAQYNGPGNSIDETQAIAVDSSGNVYVTGGSFGSNSEEDFATIKYNSVGQVQWVARYNGPENSYDYSTAIALDASGNVYVTGLSQGAGDSPDYVTIKYNSGGQEQWVTRYNGPGNDYDYSTAIAVDGSGNVYVTGSSAGGAGPDYATIKYNSAGQEQWVARYNGPGLNSDEAYAIAVDGLGNVYVTGSSDGDGFSEGDYATIKYNPTGQQQWVARYNGPANRNDYAKAIAVDGSGNAYVTGSSVRIGSNLDYATIKYNSAGQEQWVARYSGPGDYTDEGVAIALDGSGNVYVTGDSRGVVSYSDYATIKYNSAGQEQWVARYDGPGSYDDKAGAIAVDGSGNVYVTGGSFGSNSYSDYATVKYNSAGQEQWIAQYTSEGYNDDVANAIAVDGSGDVYVTGKIAVPNQNQTFDYATIKYVQTASPTPTPTATATPTATPTVTPTPSGTPRPTPTPRATGPRPRPTAQPRP